MPNARTTIVASNAQQRNPIYAPEILPLMQSLLKTLADIDFQFNSDLEVVKLSDLDDALKRNAINALEQRHEERRAPYLQAINTLKKHMHIRYN